MRRELILLYVSLLLLASGGIIRADVGESGEGPLAPACTEYDVRLAEGNNGYMGMVEACYTPPGANSSLWGPICVTSFNYWTVIHAKTICTQLGLPSKDAVAISYENVTGPYSYGLVWCSSSNPPSSLHGCDAEDIAPTCNLVKRAGGVICHVPENNTCETGAVRQVNGTKLAGRVEVCFNGLWGTVCEFEHWSSLEASVVCRQIGLGSDSSIPIGVTTDTMFGAGPSTQPILISNVVCSGNESKITECSHSDVNSVGVCLHEDDVGVICEGKFYSYNLRSVGPPFLTSAPPGSCRDGDIRVQGGTVGTVDSVSGNIEVCYTGLWGTVCASDWTNENAQVACRQLGYAEV
ncbi:Deleted in malignant brain tumors 1 protein, partial [Geodia barretti]